jgi:hypothetical protein
LGVHRREKRCVQACLIAKPTEISGSIGFAFEGIVAVGGEIAAKEEEIETGSEIGGYEEGAPAFALADVDAFVGAGPGECAFVLAEDDVPQGHGQCAAGEEGAAAEEKADQTTMEFEDALNDLEAASGEKSEGEEEEADCGSGGGPYVAEGSECLSK